MITDYKIPIYNNNQGEEGKVVGPYDIFSTTDDVWSLSWVTGERVDLGIEGFHGKGWDFRRIGEEDPGYPVEAQNGAFHANAWLRSGSRRVLVAPDPTCQCGSTNTVGHVLLEYPVWADSRRTFQIDRRTLNTSRERESNWPPEFPEGVKIEKLENLTDVLPKPYKDKTRL